MSAIQHAVLEEPSPTLLSAAVDGTGLALVARPALPDANTTDRPVGYVLVLTADAVAYVPELAVSPDWQRRGVGSVLLAAVSDRVDAEELRLTVRAEDDDARAFYRDRGFSLREALPDHYETGAGTGLLLGRPL
ncbi:MAG: GNAT family N-acetyltransferase [Halorhabdus sp.]